VEVEFVEAADASGGGWTEAVEFGCSCVCHENLGERVVTDCEWCVDCSVNKENRAREDAKKCKHEHKKKKQKTDV
jgi:hypothetical protein